MRCDRCHERKSELQAGWCQSCQDYDATKVATDKLEQVTEVLEQKVDALIVEVEHLHDDLA